MLDTWQQRTLTQIEPNPIFKGLPKQLKVGLYHSWGILQNSLQNTPLVPTAVFQDQNVLMARTPTFADFLACSFTWNLLSLNLSTNVGKLA